VLVQYTHGFLMQLLVSFGGMAIMTGLAWLLDRSEKVPNLFVDAHGESLPEVVSKPGVA
jgi:hypothetical protein